jgi:peptidyl-tRNA hydrolase, PTH1 family
MLLLVGLGNPGGDYARNRHNIGFMAVDEIVRRHSFQPFRSKFNGELAEGRIGSQKVLALKPMTYMNESGRSVGVAAGFYKIPAEDILVIHDELDLETGKLRLKSGGGHAGHNGLRSIHAHVGEGYRRLRLGIGHPGDKSKVTSHVLKDFAKADQAWLEPLLASTADHIGMVLDGDDAGFLNKVALDLNPNQNQGK